MTSTNPKSYGNYNANTNPSLNDPSSNDTSSNGTSFGNSSGTVEYIRVGYGN